MSEQSIAENAKSRHAKRHREYKKRRDDALAARIKERQEAGHTVTGQHAVMICALFDSGESVYNIAMTFGVSIAFVINVTMGRKYAGVTKRTAQQTKERNERLGRHTNYSHPRTTAT